MILVIDNYDSFVYNLARYVEELGHDVKVIRNDQTDAEEIKKLNPSHIILSPGPCSPKEAGICNDIIRKFGESKPILGVCLGHQCIGETFGGIVKRAKEPMHGKKRPLKHNGKGVFKDLPNPITVTRYHSLIVDKEDLPEDLEVTAESDMGEIMAVAHKTLPVVGVQFHPEAVLTDGGHKMLENFLEGQYR